MPANLYRHLDRAMKLRESFADVKLESIICEYPHSGMDQTRVCPFDLEGYSTVGAYHVLDQAECRYHVYLIAETEEPEQDGFTFSPIANFAPITTNPDLIRLKSEFLELCQLIEGSTDTDAVPRVCIRMHRLMKLKTVYRSTTDSLAKRVAVRDSPFGSVPVRTRWSNCEDLIKGLEHLANYDEQHQVAPYRTECEDLNRIAWDLYHAVWHVRRNMHRREPIDRDRSEEFIAMIDPLQDQLSASLKQHRVTLEEALFRRDMMPIDDTECNSFHDYALTWGFTVRSRLGRIKAGWISNRGDSDRAIAAARLATDDLRELLTTIQPENLIRQRLRRERYALIAAYEGTDNQFTPAIAAESANKSEGAAPTTLPSKSKPAKKKRGRPPKRDRDKDQKVLNAWNTGHFETYADLGRELYMTSKEVEKAIDSQKKHLKKARQDQ